MIIKESIGQIYIKINEIKSEISNKEQLMAHYLSRDNINIDDKNKILNELKIEYLNLNKYYNTLLYTEVEYEKIF